MCMEFSDRIRKAVAASGLKQNELARRVGVTPAAVNNWINRGAHDLRSDVLFALAAVSGMSPRWLATGDGPELSDDKKLGTPIESTKVPVVNFATLTGVSVGQDFDPAMMAVEWMPCPVNHGPRAFAFRVQDDANTSTIGARSYPAGCCLYVDPDHRDPVHEKPLLAVLPSGELLVAVYMAQAGSRWLRFLNPAYREYSGPFEVVGNIIGKWEDV